ncbi:hypothetical protein KNE206_42550 [Kitasatospora sp. NE20-6]
MAAFRRRAAVSRRFRYGVRDPTATGPAQEPVQEPAWRTTAATATFPEAVRENEEVVPVNAVSTWVLPSGATVGR